MAVKQLGKRRKISTSLCEASEKHCKFLADLLRSLSDILLSITGSTDNYTSSRPVRRIRFLGLFDTVNSVPRFESAWMQRSKFPYTARSSAKVVRHAVSIDERRAKFRQDLVGGTEQQDDDDAEPEMRHYEPDLVQMNEKAALNGTEEHHSARQGPRLEFTGSAGGMLSVPARLAPQGSMESLAAPIKSPSTENLHESAKSPRRHARRTWSRPKRPQDIQEIWFAGSHADIGGVSSPLLEHRSFGERVIVVVVFGRYSLT